ncbi:thermonuclease family protein [Roseovarius sp. THAF8]|uniref:thermonuclease family protein n=1 Tax=Roseovarius sp. THAF8 TaxID=2587846 RepID=UPI00126812CB|nr:thermonuclease family protein [Roseovarius sp. THAF8]
MAPYPDRDGYRCGQLAANQLDTLIGGSSVKSWTQDVDRYRRLVSVCELGNIDINAWMVEQGLAVAYRKYSIGECQQIVLVNG